MSELMRINLVSIQVGLVLMTDSVTISGTFRVSNSRVMLVFRMCKLSPLVDAQTNTDAIAVDIWKRILEFGRGWWGANLGA